MAFVADYTVLFERLDAEVRFASRPMPGLFAKIVGSACTRIPVSSRSEKSTRFERLIEAGAWTDAALVLIDLELPDWKIRRLIRDGGGWMCSLSRQPNLPESIDETVDASHELMPLAILLAFLEARRIKPTAPGALSAVPAVWPIGETVCCDNFA
jgi:hypothetical protein